MTTWKSSTKTDLSPVQAGVPWREDFEFGAGLDAVTGDVTGSALVPFKPKKVTTKGHSSTRLTVITNESDLTTEIEASASGKYNEEGVTVSASTSYLDKISLSKLAITILMHFEVMYADYDLADSYALTDEAKKMMADREKFRSAYGDYFVAGGKRGSRFTCLYTCRSESASELQKFSAKVGAETPDLFSADGAASFEKMAKSSSVDISIEIDMEGYTGTPPKVGLKPSDVLPVLEWFQKNEEGIYLLTRLQHYNTLDPTYSRLVDVAPSVFVELRHLYDTVWTARALYNGCPDTYRRQLDAEYHALNDGVEANSNQLATDTKLRRKYAHDADDLVGKLQDVADRQAFYALLAKVQEPKQGAKIYEQAGEQHRWLYGYSTWSQSAAVVINSITQHFKIKGAWLDHKKHDFEVGPDQTKLVVGWEVTANWTDGTDGHWEKSLPRIVGGHHSVVLVSSLEGRGCDWTVTVYYVDAADYQFS